MDRLPPYNKQRLEACARALAVCLIGYYNLHSNIGRLHPASPFVLERAIARVGKYVFGLLHVSVSGKFQTGEYNGCADGWVSGGGRGYY